MFFSLPSENHVFPLACARVGPRSRAGGPGDPLGWWGGPPAAAVRLEGPRGAREGARRAVGEVGARRLDVDLPPVGTGRVPDAREAAPLPLRHHPRVRQD
eukprot:gene8052-biopygen10613